jgi:hypothetical protein
MQLHRIVVILVRLNIFSYRHHRTGCPRELLAKYIKLHDIEPTRLISHFNHISLQVSECIGDSLCEIDFILVLVKVIDET